MSELYSKCARRELRPEWAGGAWLLTPFTEQDIAIMPEDANTGRAQVEPHKLRQRAACSTRGGRGPYQTKLPAEYPLAELDVWVVQPVHLPVRQIVAPT